MNRIFAILATTVALALTGAVHAAEHEVMMLNKGAKGTMVFEPDFVQAEPGDTIRFIPTDKSHNAETIKGMLPDGAQALKGKVNEEIVYTVDAEGLYGIKCLPHYGMGMVMLVSVGKPVNLDEVKAVKHPGKAKAHFEELLSALPTN
jgi:pseudoazurin